MVQMPKDSSSYIEMAYSSIKVFTDDGRLDLNELNYLLGLALKDGEIDEDEKRVLKNVFHEAEKSNISPAVKDRIKAIKEKYSI